ncbi:hypothetical protein [uncultured Lacinutrix sp.]|uniref:hypothetical protein n=1 Tax=uncultured Lacinutrix sp. TaxID=574032 RepID=UPI00262B6C7B|nr:hypothetical protein [uncultured Lacinutrix sp.]
MKLREKRRLLVYLEVLAEQFNAEDKKGINEHIIKYFPREELINVVLWLFQTTWTKAHLEFKSDIELLDIIGSDIGILLYLINRLEKSIINYPTFEQKEVTHFFSRTNNEIHYLASKPVTKWDSYDVANYRALLVRTGTTKKVYGIFTADVLSEDVYAVTTKPSYFFDTKQEAEAEIKNIEAEGQFKAEDLTIHSLWLLH